MASITSTLDIVLTDDVTKNAAQIEAALQKIASEAKAVDGVLASSGASDKFGASLKRMGASVGQVEGATKALRDYAAAEGLAADRSQWTREQATGFKNFESVTLSGVRAIMGAERALEEQRARASAERQREIAAEQRAVERQVQAEQRARVRELEQEQRLHHQALERREHAIAHHGIVNYALQSAAMAVSAHALVHVGREAWEQGAELQHERLGLVNAGRTPQEIREIERAARGVIASTPTAGMVESLKTVAETTAAFGSVEHAVSNLPFVSKMTSILKTAGGDNIHGDAAQLGQAFAKTFEERQTRPEDFEAEAKQMIPAMVATGGTFNPEQLYAFAQQAKSALPSLSMRFLSRIAPSLIGAQGGERAGTGLKAFEDVIAGKANDKKQAQQWLSLGLLDPSKVITKNGQATAWKSGAVKDTFLAMTDPLAWSEKYLIPALQKQGIDTSSREATQMILNTMFRNQNANMFATEIAQAASIARLHKDEDLFNKVGSFDEIYARNLQDFGVAAGALKSALGNLAGAVTAPLMGKVSSGLVSLADGINYLSKLALEHPTIAAGTGVVASGVALGGAGWAAYGLYNGFGLRGSAAALDAAAAHLMEVGGGPGGLGGKLGGAAAAGVEAAAPALAIPGAVEFGAAVLAGGGAVALTEILKKAAEAQQPGKGGLYAPVTEESRGRDEQDLDALRAERDDLKAKVARQKAMEKIPGTSDAPTYNDRQRIAQLESAIAGKERSFVDLDAVTSHEARVGRAMMAMKAPEEFGPNLPPELAGQLNYIDREAERGRAYAAMRRPEEFGPPVPPTSAAPPPAAAPAPAPTSAPVAPQIDLTPAEEGLMHLMSLSTDAGQHMTGALNVTASPTVDTGSISSAIALVQQLISMLGQAGAAAASARAAVASAAAGGANASIGARRSMNRTPTGATTA